MPETQSSNKNTPSGKKRFFSGFSSENKPKPQTQKIKTPQQEDKNAIAVQKAQRQNKKQTQVKKTSPKIQDKTQKKNTTDPKEISLKITTSKALKYSWLNIITTWGLSLIYINIHIFAKKIFKRKGFSEPGVEIFTNPLKSDPQAFIKKEKNNLVKIIGMGEFAIVIFIDLAILALFFILILMAMMPFILTITAYEGIKSSIGYLFEGII